LSFSFSSQIISGDISELQKNQATTVAKIAQYKRKLMDLSHRVLQVQATTARTVLLAIVCPCCVLPSLDQSVLAAFPVGAAVLLAG